MCVNSTNSIRQICSYLIEVLICRSNDIVAAQAEIIHIMLFGYKFLSYIWTTLTVEKSGLL